MNTTPDTAVSLASGIRDRLEGRKVDQTRVIVCPPFVSLDSVARALEGSEVSVGAQNLHSEPSGAFTGEISAEMLRGLAEFVIVGHSERRTLFAESDELIGAKVEAASAAGLKPILCVGETLQQRSAGEARETVERQVANGLSKVNDVSQTMIAYEPVWAIGTGEAATPEVAQEMMASIRVSPEVTVRRPGRFGPAALWRQRERRKCASVREPARHRRRAGRRRQPLSGLLHRDSAKRLGLTMKDTGVSAS